jgi:DNA repair protein RecO (recombination protein O)
MAPVETQALVLRSLPYSNTSQLVYTLTPEGPVHLMAKGSLRQKNHFNGPINELTILSLTYTPPRKHDGLGDLRTARLSGWYPGLGKSLAAFYGAEFIREALLAVPTPPDESPATLEIATGALAALNAGRDALPVATQFAARMLTLHGLTPELAGCVQTGRPASGKNPVDFSLRESGLLCPPAAAGKPGLIRLSVPCLALLRRLFEDGEERDWRAWQPERTPSPTNDTLDTSATAFMVCHRLLENAVHRELRSAAALVAEARRGAAPSRRSAS